MIIGIVRFWQIFVIDLTGNLTGTSLTTFMLCSIELMLAGLCISIPKLRPFYLQWRAKYKSPTSDGVQESKGAAFKSSRSNHLAVNQENRGHMSWIELVG